MGQNPEYNRPRLQGRQNDVTPKQEELLVRLMEECAELTKECSKILRWGWGSYNPHDPMRGTNEKNFYREVADVDDIVNRIKHARLNTGKRRSRQHPPVRRPRKSDTRG